MTDFIELTSETDEDMRWLINVESIAFVRRTGSDDAASILLNTGGVIAPDQPYSAIVKMLARFGGIA